MYLGLSACANTVLVVYLATGIRCMFVHPTIDPNWLHRYSALHLSNLYCASLCELSFPMARWNRSSIYVNVTSAPALPDVHLIDICIFMCMANYSFR